MKFLKTIKSQWEDFEDFNLNDISSLRIVLTERHKELKIEKIAEDQLGLVEGNWIENH